jgi:hypothetical protein
MAISPILLDSCSATAGLPCPSNRLDKIASSNCRPGFGTSQIGLEVRPSKQEIATSEMGCNGQFALPKC